MNLLSRLFGGSSIPTLTIQQYQQGFLEAKQAHTLLDVRTVGEYQGGHLPKAINIPLGQLAQKLDQIPADKPVVCVCASGSRSASAASLLSQAGREVYNLRGGFFQWQLENRPIEKSKAP